MPKVTEAHVEARRQQILDAARSCFSRNGFHETTMNDLCQDAHLSPGAVYRYFRSKEEIIEAMAEEGRRRNLALIEAAKEQGTTLQVLDELAKAFFSLLDDPTTEEACRVDIELWGEALRNPTVLDSCLLSLDVVRRPLVEIVRRAQERRDINPALDPEAVARVMVSLFDGLLLQKELDPAVDVWSYVAAAMAMVTGSFWQGDNAEAQSSQG